jgi:hypothetical protein
VLVEAAIEYVLSSIGAAVLLWRLVISEATQVALQCQLNAVNQTRVLLLLQSAYYVSLIMCQFWHIWTCKTRVVSLAPMMPS